MSHKRALSWYEFFQQPIPLLILAILIGAVGVKYFAPLLFVCELLLVYDFYRWGASHSRTWSCSRYLGFVLTTSSLLAGILWLVRVQEDAAARKDAWANIIIEYSIPSRNKNDPMKSRITVTNNSGQNITNKHMLTCESVLTVNGKGLLNQGIISAQRNTSKSGWYIASRQPEANEIEQSFPLSGKAENGNQDATTESCLGVWDIGPIVCSDIKITFYYFLATQPVKLQHIAKRIVTSDDGSGTFEWYPESLERPASRCCPGKGTEFRDFNMWCYGNPSGPVGH
jgi:hypothetical protein